MKILCVGLNWKTPVTVRERLAFDQAELPAALARLKTEHSHLECAILSTCNRTEIYTVDPEATEEVPRVSEEALCTFLARYHQIARSDFDRHLYALEDAQAVTHLLCVASGLDSLILGEAQVLGQVKQAYQAAIDAQTTGRVLNLLFRQALRSAKRVHSETRLARGRLSVASAAVDYIRGVFEYFDDKTVLVIGAGKMAELAITHLQELHPQRLVICNRSRDRAEALADRFGGSARAFEELPEALVEADIVISSTGADEPLLTAEDFLPIQMQRNRLMTIIDISVPRDIDPAINELEDVWLWNIDDLVKVRDQTMLAREGELDKALNIVDEETDAFAASMALQQSGPLIGRLDKEYQRIVEQELAWLLPQLNGVTEEQRLKIQQFAHRLKNKFLHPPKAAIRREARRGHAPHRLSEALRKLFGLQED